VRGVRGVRRVRGVRGVRGVRVVRRVRGVRVAGTAITLTVSRINRALKSLLLLNGLPCAGTSNCVRKSMTPPIQCAATSQRDLGPRAIANSHDFCVSRAAQLMKCRTGSGAHRSNDISLKPISAPPVSFNAGCIQPLRHY
jgi:hypothetical protein